jgi:hypothetical protein
VSWVSGDAAKQDRTHNKPWKEGNKKQQKKPAAAASNGKASTAGEHRN